MLYGHIWRRTFWHNVIYTDWDKGKYFRAVERLISGVKRLGIEFDTVSIGMLTLLISKFPTVEFVNIAQPTMQLRMIKSAEEISHITEMARIAEIGGAACFEAVNIGVPEHGLALHSTATMQRKIAKSGPDVELPDTGAWFQSGINTDGAHYVCQPRNG